MKRAIVAVLLLVGAAACREETPGYTTIGDAQRGEILVTRYGCLACHSVDGSGNGGEVGPPFDSMAQRKYVAGQFPNVPQNMIAWVRFPQHMKPQTAMPELGVNDRDARDIAAFLYTLR